MMIDTSRFETEELRKHMPELMACIIYIVDGTAIVTDVLLHSSMEDCFELFRKRVDTYIRNAYKKDSSDYVVNDDSYTGDNVEIFTVCLDEDATLKYQLNFVELT